MRSRLRMILAPSGALLLAAGLAGCDGDSGGGGGGGGGGVTTPQSQFGGVFEDAFNNNVASEDNQPGGFVGDVDVTAEPVAVAAGDLGSVSFTTDPIAIP